MANMTIPTSQAELEELLADTSKVSALTNSGQMPEVIKAYAKFVDRNDPDIKAQVDAQVKSVLFDYLRDNGVKNANHLQVLPGQGKKTSVFNAAAPGAQVEKEFTGVANYFQSIWHNAERTPELVNKLNTVRNATSSYDGASGGFLVPETIRSEILELALEDSVIRPRATVIPMSSPRVLVPAVDVTSHVSSVYGGITAYWEAESTALNDVNPAFDRVTLDAHKLTAYTEVPNELLADGVAFEAFIARAFPRAMAFYEDNAFLNGTGVGQPQGLYNSSAAAIVTKETNQPAATIVWENIIKMYSRMLPSSLNNAVWIVPPSAFPELATMALNVGVAGSAVWLTNGADKAPMTILGRPVIVTEKAKALGTQGDVTFADLSYYLVGDRQMMTATSSPHFKFQTDQTAFKVISRVDGRVWVQSAVTPKNAGPALSPIVQLGARS